MITFPAFHQMSPLRRWASTNIDATSFASKVSTTTRPAASATAAVLDLNLHFGDGLPRPAWMKLFFILLGADEDAASFRIIQWDRATADGLTTLYQPSPLYEFSCTASTAVGVAASAVLNTERYADVITVAGTRAALQPRLSNDNGTSAEFAGTCYVRSPADDTIGFAVIPILGSELLELTIDQTTNTPTCNILYSFLR